MGDAKDIVLKPISSREANELVKHVHYSGKVVQNSQIHIGVFYHGKLEGAMQFGSPMDKRKILPLVEGTQWHNMLELNRMAFSDVLPRNSESRAISIAMKILRKHAPQVKWVISFADATQCGDGAIYRASGFVLTAVKENSQLYRLPFSRDVDNVRLLSAGLTPRDVTAIKNWLDSITTNKMSLEGAPHAHKMSLEGAPHAHKMSLEGGVRPNRLLSDVKQIMRKVTNGATSADALFRLIGGEPSKGYQLRYIYFIDKSWRDRLTVPELPYSKIDELGAGMYRGEKK